MSGIFLELYSDPGVCGDGGQNNWIEVILRLIVRCEVVILYLEEGHERISLVDPMYFDDGTTLRRNGWQLLCDVCNEVCSLSPPGAIHWSGCEAHTCANIAYQNR